MLNNFLTSLPFIKVASQQLGAVVRGAAKATRGSAARARQLSADNALSKTRVRALRTVKNSGNIQNLSKRNNDIISSTLNEFKNNPNAINALPTKDRRLMFFVAKQRGLNPYEYFGLRANSGFNNALGSRTANQAAAKASTNLEKAVSNPAFSATTNPGSNTINMNLAGSNAPVFNAAVGGEAMNLTTAAERAAANTAARNAIGKPTSAWSKSTGTSGSTAANNATNTANQAVTQTAGQTANNALSREELAELINNAANSSRGLAWKVGLGSALGGGLLGTMGSRIFAPDPTIQYVQPSTQYYRQPEFIY